MFLANLFALAIAQSGAASAEIVPPGRWTLDYGQLSCTLARRAGEAGSPIVALNAPLGHEPGEFVVIDGGTGLDPRLAGELDIRIDGSAPLTVRATRERRNGRGLVKLAPMPDNFLNLVAAARELAVRKSGEEVLTLNLSGARAAVEGMSSCNDDLLQSWGINIAARDSLSRRPAAGSMRWALDITSSNDTSLVFVANISEQGRPLDCRVVVSSGNERMDRAFCDLVRSRARFEPGLDAGGAPVPAQYVTRVRWWTQ